MLAIAAACTYEQDVQKLVRQAQQGDPDAYMELALCYRDGNGVEKSWLNMVCMYAAYCRKTGEDPADIVTLFDEGHPFRLLTDCLNASELNEETSVILQNLKNEIPADAKAVEALMNLFVGKDDDRIISALTEAEQEGSELVPIFWAIYCDKRQDRVFSEECYARLSEKSPVFYLLLGDLYLGDFNSSEDVACLHKAIEYYYTADEYGMLFPKYANRLWGLYDYYGAEGFLTCNARELRRLRKIAVK